MLAAWRGREAEARQLIAGRHARDGGPRRRTVADHRRVGDGGAPQRPGPLREALAAAEQGSEYPYELGLATWSLAELIEAAARTGEPERAAGALRQLSEATGAAATDWALGIEARCGRCSATASPPSGSTARRSSGSAGPGSARSWPARTCSTASGCAARTAAWTRASSSASPTRCWPRWAPRGSPSVPAASCWPPARPCASARSRRPASSPRRRRRSPGSPATGRPTRRSAPSCSSARARSNGTCARCSRSSASARGKNSAGPCPASSGQARWPYARRLPRHSTSSSRRFVLVSSTSSSPPPDRTVLVAHRVKPLIWS